MKYLLLEGITDVAFVKYICCNKDITNNFDDFEKENNEYKYKDLVIVDLQGQDKLEKFLKRLNKKIVKISKIGIIQDADDNFEKSKIDIEDAIKNSKINNANIEYFLTPNNKENGDLETLFISTINKDNSILKCFESYAECLSKKNDVHEKALNKGKVYAYTMYSQSGENLYKPQDSFINKKNKQDQDTKLWDLSQSEFQPFIDFVSKIFK